MFPSHVSELSISKIAAALKKLTLSVKDAEIFLNRRNVRRNDAINLIY